MDESTWKKAKAICMIAIGSLSIIFCFACFFADTGVFERQTSYGGDAYTGIQNAGAITANNVKCVAQTLSIGFGSVLLVGGLALVMSGVFSLISPKQTGTPDTTKAGRAISISQEAKEDEHIEPIKEEPQSLTKEANEANS